ncbi:MAG: hypothetical protein H7061_09655 [Bdellovibrionaceae bacterium]|nr:hypothetical protein [Bdellovibrio sp.]
MKLFLIYFLFASLSFAKPGEIFDVVFDLDWTLVNKTTESMAARDKTGVIRIGLQPYRISAGAIQQLVRLHRDPRFRVSFYSGGNSNRNNELIAVIYQEIQKYDATFKTHLILNQEDLVEIEGVPASAPFSERFKKNLLKVNSNLNRVFLIDDIANYTLPGQEENVLWLGRTYEDTASFADAIARARKADEKTRPYYPTTEQEWRNDKLKIVSAVDIIFEAVNSRHPIATMNYLSAQKPPLKRSVQTSRQCSQLFQ